ncbi:hypothetical protein QWY86_04795 [Pedobacter aquatilis]|uniref:hypothetical protein n=1 Tax=Pedobacter aquatilis TaxID=351343 RepID=UPI0025B60218|nr:hypothetical protein [Pedobacter aquatilis]MDN3585973.1 hypothetical protein [Pedobacter aquatilis]
MKKSIFLIALLLLIFSRKKENTQTQVINEKVGLLAVSKTAGNFSNGPYGSVSGVGKGIYGCRCFTSGLRRSF